MEPFLRVSGPTAALPLPNIDTDVIVPKQFLKGIDCTGLDRAALHELRFDADGHLRPNFVLNQPAWRGARFLMVGPNFGCSSSREHAVWGLLQLGIRAVIGTSFAGIFADDAANNGLLLLSLPVRDVQVLSGHAADPARSHLVVDLETQTVEGDGLQLSFRIDPLRRHALLRGLDVIGGTLEQAQAIHAFQEAYLASQPWLA